MPPWGEPVPRAVLIGGSARFPRVHWLRGSRARGSNWVGIAAGMCVGLLLFIYGFLKGIGSEELLVSGLLWSLQCGLPLLQTACSYPKFCLCLL
ncbi:hypothetical protein NPIL_627251 [Nephila pilipes]|uniref:Uncharacterized protein n=1 Tax=Nephila pilipes TaxID=299642 RepID=A0A8X6N5D3_NEPPI|nr:hypothetical protein NPIL_627251 [Nephila pilipes]